MDNIFSVNNSNYLITLYKYYYADVLFLLFSVYSKASAGNAELNQEQKE
ncbi:hypothetical protein ALC62_12147 [Cyphomyrmex costatus]|uniref:Uncharacterized protein n=1 Tax=Cyphomyrmex costatus TaxID=456900 RepID=A0A151IBU9_9HYME|nr:hypothetical protein ALC62_12147 [Cyphomyrmex costatus]